MLTREKGGLSPEFEERMRFYRATCNIDLRDYIYETDERLQLDIASFRRDVMASVLEAYDRNAPGIVGDEAMRAELLQSYERDGGVNEVPPSYSTARRSTRSWRRRGTASGPGLM